MVVVVVRVAPVVMLEAELLGLVAQFVVVVMIVLIIYTHFRPFFRHAYSP